MKKKILILLFSILPFFCFAKERNFFGFQFGIGGTIPLYADKAVWDNHSKMSDENFARFIIGGDVGFTLKLAKPLFLVFDFESCADFSWNSDYYSNSLDYAFSAGFQFYPNTQNLSVSIFYSIGTRTDFVKLPERFEQIERTKWGNGFKIAVEYDFISGGGVIPVLGAYYRFMPRGYDKYDNILSIYFRLAFR
ncbi:MAG: hypothetical protein ACI4LX_08555 [Treponema sp.]